jgi:hypothetical protein
MQLLSLFSSKRFDGASLYTLLVVQGFGMALATATLTTTALDSVEADYAGLASGVNNAVGAKEATGRTQWSLCSLLLYSRC